MEGFGPSGQRKKLPTGRKTGRKGHVCRVCTAPVRTMEQIKTAWRAVGKVTVVT